MIGIIDYGLGNIHAINHIYNQLNIESVFISKPDQLTNVEKIILPGVGSFDRAMECLHAISLIDTLNELVLNKKIPILGICVGMQIMFEGSDEGLSNGLGWI